jgi:AraC-like DNA-binding protein
MNPMPTRSWAVEGLSGVECLRAEAIRHPFARHSHEAYALGVIEAGVGGNSCRGALTYTIAGGIVAIGPGEVHTGFPADDLPLSYRMVYVPSDALSICLGEGPATLHFPEVSLDPGPWGGRLRRLHRLLERPADLAERQSGLIDFLGGFAQAFGRPAPSLDSGREPAAVRTVKEYLHGHLQQSVSVEELARITGLHRAYLIRSFRQAVGIPPYAYLVQLRVERAKRLLAGGMAAAQVALACGFADQSHLCRYFKRVTGTTPLAYRRGHYRPRR